MTSAEVDVGWCEIGDAFVVSQVVVVVDEGFDLPLKITGEIIVLEQDAVLERLVPTLDLALGLVMHGSSPDMFHSF